MNGVQFGDIVFLHLFDGSTVPSMVIEVISATEVKLIPLDVRPEVSASPPRVVDKPVYMYGSGPGQWEKMNVQLSPFHKEMVEQIRVGLALGRHIFKLMEVPFAPQVEAIFEAIARIYENKQLFSPFTEVAQRQPPSNDDGYFYELLMMGVQEGLRSSLHFLNRFFALKNLIQRESVHTFAASRHTSGGSFGITAHMLQAEYEGFVFLSRATLDRLAYFLMYYFQPDNKQSVNLYRLESFLKKDYSFHPKAIQVINVINAHRSYLDTLLKGQPNKATERNRMAHQEYVGFATPNVHYAVDGTVEVVLVYKGGLHADGAVELGQRYDELEHLVLNMLRAFFDLP